MYLLDTNILLEYFLDQEKADEVDTFLRTIPVTNCAITEFTLYSLGLILVSRKYSDTFLRFVNDALSGNAMRLIRLKGTEMERIVAVTQQFKLDFDDAYQYTVSEIYNLQIVSFDTDFDRTDRGRKTPAEILMQL